MPGNLAGDWWRGVEDPEMIETRRLLLRPFEPGDLEPYAVIRSRPSNARYLPGGEAGAKESADRTRTVWGHDAWAADGYASWAVVDKASSRLIGHLGLRYLAEIKETELLYLIDEPWWGQGIATEGGLAAVEFARTRLGLQRLVAFALPENGASIAVMRKLGFLLEAKQSIFGLDAVRYALALGEQT
jgi:ribosomal-protein-alanine N-acetyltransferase